MTKRNQDAKIDNSAENWENGLLGRDEEFVKLAEDVTSTCVDDTLELQMISIRLQKGLIRDLKAIAKHHEFGGYQPLIRKILERSSESEADSL